MPDPQEIIRETREGKGMTQSDMAEKIASAIGGTYSLRQYQRLESGEFPKYKTDIVKTVESILNISVYDMIYDKNVPRNTQAEETESQYNAPKGVTLIDTQAGANDYLSRRQHLKNNGGAFMVPLIPVAAQAGYSKSYTNPVFINQLETFAILPGIDPHGAAWRYFEVEGDSMEDTFKEGQYLLTSQVIKEDWRNIENFYVYVIITGDKVMVKRLAMQQVLLQFSCAYVVLYLLQTVAAKYEPMLCIAIKVVHVNLIPYILSPEGEYYPISVMADVLVQGTKIKFPPWKRQELSAKTYL